jgi:hypothetical protein
MLLFKLPMDIFQEIMTYQHQDQTREEAEKLVNARRGMSAITNVFNKPKAKPKPVGTDRYYGEGGI